jgi:isocitrate dehydrogenase (NAD+)
LAKKTAAIIRGDGTGPELVEAMIKVLRACDTMIELIPCDAGSEWWQQVNGPSYIPPEVWKLLEDSDACFKGPTTTIANPNAPRSVAVSIRQKFELYANIRPIKTYKNSEKQYILSVYVRRLRDYMLVSNSKSVMIQPLQFAR